MSGAGKGERDGPGSGPLGGLTERTIALERLAASARRPLDLLVVGGGVTGAGIALDAAARGARVGLVERADFAAGTSSKSSKLIHGGLRYLEQREFGLVREAATERDLLARLAPHLVEPIRFVLPVTGRALRAKLGAGLWAYDALASFKTLHVHKYVDAAETEALVPALPRTKVRGGFLYHDCKTDDVRLVMEILIAAQRRGAVAVNYAGVVGLEGSEGGCRAEIRDEESGAVLDVRARRVVVAAGVWADQVERLADPEATARLRPSKGVHLLFRRSDLPVSEAASLIPAAEGRRMLFIVPWLDAVLVGTTDTAYSGDIDSPSVDESDSAYVLAAVNSAFELALTEKDVTGAYAGFRPLVAGRAGETADLSRRHAIYDIAPGISGITGGKLTTWRRMAAEAVDRVAEDLGIAAETPTRSIRLGSSNLGALASAVTRRARALHVTPEAVPNLIRCYGDRALAVLDVAADTGLIEPLVPRHPQIAAEAVYCARAESVVHLADLLERRTRLALTDRAAGCGAGSQAPGLLADALGWSRKQRKSELEHHRTLVARERGAVEAAEAARGA